MYHVRILGLSVIAAGLTLGACSDARMPSESAAARAVAGAPSDAAISSGDFISIDVPGATTTLALDINERGQIVGRYKSAGVTHGFLRDHAGAITTIDFPGSVFTVAAGINSRGDIVGMYAMPDAPGDRHGYLLRNGAYTNLDPTGSVFTNALGINDRGDVTGRFCTGECDAFEGFRRRGGTYTTIDYPGAAETDAWKSKNDGMAVGGYLDDQGQGWLFVTGEDGLRTVPLANGAGVSMDNGGINERGDIVGIYCDGEPTCSIFPGEPTHGFLLVDHNTMATVDFPGSVASAAIGINAQRDIVGSWFDADGVLHGFLRRHSQGREGSR